MNGADASKTLSPKNVLLRFSARVFVCPISLADKDEIEDPWPKSRNPQYVAAASCMRGKAAARIPSLPRPLQPLGIPFQFSPPPPLSDNRRTGGRRARRESSLPLLLALSLDGSWFRQSHMQQGNRAIFIPIQSSCMSCPPARARDVMLTSLSAM